jgi:hypothetical protein
MIITAIFAPYVGISYAFISILPLEVLVEGKANLGDGKKVLLAPPAPELVSN